MKKFHTDLDIKRLIKQLNPAGGRVEFMDEFDPSLRLRVTPGKNGRPAKAKWSHVYREPNRKRPGKDGAMVRAQGRDPLGEYRGHIENPSVRAAVPEVSLSDARKMVIDRLKDAAGRDLKPPKPASLSAAAPSFTVADGPPKDLAELIDRYMVHRGAARLRESTLRGDWNSFNVHILPHWGSDRDYRTIQRWEVTNLLKAVKERRPGAIRPIGGPRAIGHTAIVLRGLFQWAMEEQYCDDPTIYTKVPTGVARARTLCDDEIRAVWKAAFDIGYPGGAIYMLAFLTAQRRSEIAEMKKSELDFERCVWKLPAERINHTGEVKGKSGRTHEIPLSQPALDILRSLPEMPGPWVFTSDGTAPFNSLSRLKRRIDRAVTETLGHTPDHWVLHDLRRTADTEMNRLGAMARIPDVERNVDRVLNHLVDDVSKSAWIYNRHDYLEQKREILDLWAHRLSEIVPAPMLPAFKSPPARLKKEYAAKAATKTFNGVKMGRKYTIPPHLRAEAVRLHTVDGKSFRFIGAKLGYPYGTVSDAVQRERQLSAALQKEAAD